jgi:hypothetical protein
LGDAFRLVVGPSIAAGHLAAQMSLAESGFAEKDGRDENEANRNRGGNGPDCLWLKI